jgi:type II secretory pathway pseudopilin PulG
MLRSWNFTNHGKVAFTLAEVLITLGIIGIVAALTLPPLLKNIQAAEYSSRLKKTLSAMNSGAKLAKAKYDIDFSNINARCSANSASDDPYTNKTACAIMNGVWSNAKYYYGTNKLKMKNGQPYKFTGYHATVSSFKNFSINPTYVLSDGTIVMFSSLVGWYSCSGNDVTSATRKPNSTTGNGCYGIIDVNGVNGPNKEATCSRGENSDYGVGKPETETCVIDNNDIVDVYPFAVFNDRVEVFSSAGTFMLNR